MLSTKKRLGTRAQLLPGKVSLSPARGVPNHGSNSAVPSHLQYALYRLDSQEKNKKGGHREGRQPISAWVPGCLPWLDADRQRPPQLAGVGRDLAGLGVV